MTPAERTAKIAELRAEADRLEREGRALECSEDDAWEVDRAVQAAGHGSLPFSRVEYAKAIYALAVSRLLTIKTPDALTTQSAPEKD